MAGSRRSGSKANNVITATKKFNWAAFVPVLITTSTRVIKSSVKAQQTVVIDNSHCSSINDDRTSSLREEETERTILLSEHHICLFSLLLLSSLQPIWLPTFDLHYRQSVSQSVINHCGGRRHWVDIADNDKTVSKTVCVRMLWANEWLTSPQYRDNYSCGSFQLSPSAVADTSSSSPYWLRLATGWRLPHWRGGATVWIMPQ